MPILSEKGKIGISINNNFLLSQLKIRQSWMKFTNLEKKITMDLYLFCCLMNLVHVQGTKDYEFETSSSIKKVQSLILLRVMFEVIQACCRNWVVKRIEDFFQKLTIDFKYILLPGLISMAFFIGTTPLQLIRSFFGFLCCFDGP